jgi:Ras-related protein Rab-21
MVKKKLKVVMLGEGRVGKTSLLHRFLRNDFDENCASTVKANMYANTRMEIGGHIADVAVWDTAGQEKYHALGPIYYREAHGAVLVYDITDKESFKRVRVWLKELHQVVGEGIAVCVVGNKVDMERDRKVSKTEAEEWCREHGVGHILCSAKLGIRVQDAFQYVVGKALDRELGKSGAASGQAGDGTSLGMSGGGAGSPTAAGGRSRGLKVALDDPTMGGPRQAQERKPEKKCCK